MKLCAGSSTPRRSTVLLLSVKMTIRATLMTRVARIVETLSRYKADSIWRPDQTLRRVWLALRLR